MQWSRYNRLFRLERHGPFLYNALSNILLEVDEAHFRALEHLRDTGSLTWTDGEAHEGFTALLRQTKILVIAGDEEGELMVRQYQRNAVCFDTSRLGLTINPTLQCNFRCPYCYEKGQQDGPTMSQTTIARLEKFVQSFKEIRHLTVTWYGGEPLLAFPLICDLTARMQKLGPDFAEAALITNGYLLTEEKIARLDDLKINVIQITLDGPREVHDVRRVLPGGGPTFDRILENVTALMNSSWTGRCVIRVNIDRHNLDGYLELRAGILDRFRGRRVAVYPGQVSTRLTHTYDHACNLNLREWADFLFDVYHRVGVRQSGGFYPQCEEGCVAVAHHGFVIGPSGELFKCWEDVDKPAMAIGSLHDDPPVTNPELRARYAVGTDPYNDPVCRACDVLPICGGGCSNKRLRARHFGEQGLEFCSVYRDSLIPHLEAYVDGFRTSELCDALLTSKSKHAARNGYRVISPGFLRGL